MKPEQAAALRAPFKPNQIGKLPRVTCRACSDNKSERHCPKHKMVRCSDCGAWITEAHIHLDYVGHAATTDRLLQVDPEWSWAPLAHGQDGLPAFDKAGGLWIQMTVCGVTRIGYGDQGNGKGAKEAIGDAIRNAAMRFGVALDLWAKEDLQAESRVEAESKPGYQPPKSILEVAEGDAAKVITKAQQKRLWTIARQDASLSDAAVKNIVMAVTGQESTGQIPRHLYDEVISQILGAAA